MSSELAEPILLAVIIFVLSQVIQRLVLEPWSEQRKVIGEIAGALLYLGNIMHVSVIKARREPVVWAAQPDEAVRTLRSLAGRLRASLWAIPFYGFWAFLRLVPKRAVVLSTSQNLVGWSNSIYTGEPTVFMKTIVKALKLPSDY